MIGDDNEDTPFGFGSVSLHACNFGSVWNKRVLYIELQCHQNYTISLRRMKVMLSELFTLIY